MKIEENVSFSQFTTFKVGGPARFFVVVQSPAELQSAIKFATDKKVKIFILGGGSNILASDKGFDGLAVKNEIKGVEWGEREVVASAGENWDEFVAETVKRGFFGLENLSGIPGTVGAAPVQNIGAYGVEVKDVISFVETLDSRTGAARKFSNTECKFSYRDSFFKTSEGKNFIITRVAFKLARSGVSNISYKDLAKYFADRAVPSLAEVRDAVLQIRAGKFPDLAKYGTAGSFFKNPIITKEKYIELVAKFPGLPSYPWDERNVKIPLAWILDNVCKIKGFRRADVGLYENQPLVLVNFGHATPAEVEKFATDIAAQVYKKTGIKVEREVESVG